MGQKERLIPRLFSCAEKYEKNLVLSEWRVIAIYRKPIGDAKYPYIPYGAMKAYRSGGGDWESYIDTKLLPPP